MWLLNIGAFSFTRNIQRGVSTPGPRANSDGKIRSPNDIFSTTSIRSLEKTFGSSFKFAVKSPSVAYIETCFCFICLENVAKDEMFTVGTCIDVNGSEYHQHCRSCMSGFMTAQIDYGVIVHRCPGESCSALLSDDEIASLVKEGIMARYYQPNLWQI